MPCGTGARCRSRPEWAGRKVLLHFQAVDYDATVWVNGQEVARHRGGFTPFTCDLRRWRSPGETCADRGARPRRSRPGQAPGKQSRDFANHGCMYTRTTGIWQTVWMEPVAETYFLPPAHHPGRGHAACSTWNCPSAAAGPG